MESFISYSVHNYWDCLTVTYIIALNNEYIYFFTSTSKYNSLLYLSLAFQLNVGYFRADLVLLMLMLGLVTVALFLLMGPAASDMVWITDFMAFMPAFMIVCIIACACPFSFFSLRVCLIETALFESALLGLFLLVCLIETAFF